MSKFFKILALFVLLFNFKISYSQLSLDEQNNFLDSVINLSKSASLDLISIIDQDIDRKNQLINILKNNINQIDIEISNNESYYNLLNKDLEKEKQIYADLIVRAQRLSSMMHQNFDIFSFDNLYTTYRQFLYIKWMSDYRKKKIEQIRNLKKNILSVLDELDKNIQKKNALAEQLGVKNISIKEHNIKRQSISEILKEENKEDLHINLDSLKVSRGTNNTSSSDTSTLFQIQKGYLIWPVQHAVIINGFGERHHPVYEKVILKNDGVDFCVPTDSKVRCVYQGIVTKVTLLPNNKYVVIVRHGNYYTVYNGLGRVNVSVGDSVEKESIVGSFISDDFHSIFNFQVWNGTESENPVKWLKKK